MPVSDDGVLLVLARSTAAMQKDGAVNRLAGEWPRSDESAYSSTALDDAFADMDNESGRLVRQAILP